MPVAPRTVNKLTKLTINKTHRVNLSICQLLNVSNSRGFTMIELLIAISIVAVLSGIGIYTFQNAQQKGRDSTRKQEIAQVKAALELYFQENHAYPPGSGAIGTCSTTEVGGSNYLFCPSTLGGNSWIPGLNPYLQTIPTGTSQLINPTVITARIKRSADQLTSVVISNLRHLSDLSYQSAEKLASLLAPPKLQSEGGLAPPAPQTSSTQIAQQPQNLQSQTRTAGQVLGAGSQGPRNPTAANIAVGAFCTSPCNNNWTNVNNILNQDSIYAYSVQSLGAGSYLIYGYTYGFTVPSNATITGISLSVNRWSPLASTVVDKDIFLLKGGGILSVNKADPGTYWPSVNTARTYGGSNDLWGLGWTPADINGNLVAGVGCKQVATTSNSVCYVDSIQLTVYYTTPDPPPTVTTGSATNVTPTAATLNGTVNPNGSNTAAYFRWGTSNVACASLPNVTSVQSAGSGTSAVAISANISLPSQTTYYYCAIGNNAGGAVYGSVLSFTNRPDIYTNSAALNTVNNCTGLPSPLTFANGTVLYLCGNMINQGAVATGSFRTSVYRNQPTQPAIPSNGDSGQNWTLTAGQNTGIVVFGSFTAGTTGCALAATNTYRCDPAAFGDSLGSQSESNESNNFSSFPQYTVTTGVPDLPTGLIPNTNVVGGLQQIRWNNQPGINGWYVRIDDTIDPWAPASCDSVPNATSIPTTGDVCSQVRYDMYTGSLQYNFQPGHTYNWWIHARNPSGIGNATGASLTATYPPPTVTIGSYTITNGDTATLNAGANPNGTAATGYFRVHTSLPPSSNCANFATWSGNTRVPATGGTSLGAGTSNVNFSQAAIGLSPNSNIYWCAYADNSGGTGSSSYSTLPTNGPIISTSDPENVTSTSATLKGYATDAPNSNWRAYFRYANTNPGTCTDNTLIWSSTRLPSSGGTTITAGTPLIFSQNITVSPNTAYYYCAMAYYIFNPSLVYFESQPKVINPVYPYAVTWGSQSPPTTMFTSEVVNTTITITNTGSATWINTAPNPVNFGALWYSGACPPSGSVLSKPRTNIGTTVAPNGTLNNFAITITAPATPGTYCLAYDMVAEGDCWFSAASANCGASPTKNTTVTVGNPPLPPTAQISADKTVANKGEAVQLTWTSTNAVTCTASGAGDFTGDIAVTGNQTVFPQATTTYSIDCVNSASQHAQSSVTVTLSTIPITNTCYGIIGYCYIAIPDSNGNYTRFVLWAQLENKNDSELSTKPSAACTDSSPNPNTFNYCLKND